VAGLGGGFQFHAGHDVRRPHVPGQWGHDRGYPVSAALGQPASYPARGALFLRALF